MIKKVAIRNFKSLKSVEFDARRVNIFIGRPNTGKSNLLEALGMFALRGGNDARELIRWESISNLHFESNPALAAEIQLDERRLILTHRGGRTTVSYHASEKSPAAVLYSLDNGGNLQANQLALIDELRIKTYRFKILKNYPDPNGGALAAPHGANLQAVLHHNKELRKLVSDVFSDYGYTFVLKPQESRIELQKIEDDIAISYPFWLISDSLQRIVFHMVAIETNTDAVLLLEEPESNSFPYYTKHLAELIAQDEKNQYFLTTHNPYLILSLLEKTPLQEIAVHVTGFREYQTILKTLNDDQMQEILGQTFDLFFSVEKYLDPTE